MAAIVHHGGPGTTGAALRAGKPNIVVPHTADQPFWGRRVYTLGAGPPPIPAAKLSADKLARAIEVTLKDKTIQANASELGEQIRREDGVENAVELIERYVRAY
jgi:sterol 3beta-glucosyltransferase